MKRFTFLFILGLFSQYSLLGQNVGIGTTAPAELLHLSTDKSAVILLEADKDNITETDQPRVEFHQDGGIIKAVVGFAGGTNHLTIQNNFKSPDADIEFFTDSMSRMTIDGTGKIGMGTKNPSERLDVAGNIAIPFGGILRTNATSHTSRNILKTGWISGVGDHLDLMVPGNVQAENNLAVRILETGNVGIGSTNPAHKLTVANGYVSVGKEYGIVTAWESGSEYGYLLHATGIQSLAGIGANAPHDFGSQIRSDALIAFVETDQEKVSGWMNLNNNQFIWNGRISSSEVLVQTSVWADYVFKKGYQLKSLNEVESFIQTNGHLPNTPSQEEVVAKGINVSEMTNLQQEKIEELFLHTIEQQKQIELLKAEIELLKEGH